MYMKVGRYWYLVEVRVDDLDPKFVAKVLGQQNRFYPLGGNVNAKSRGSRTVVAAEKQVVSLFTQSLRPSSKRDYDRARAAWLAAKKNLRDEFQDLVAALQDGTLTEKGFLSKAKALLRMGYEKAYRLGTDAGGMSAFKLPAEDLKWLERARRAEYRFLDKFASDIVHARGSMSYKARANMYVDTMDSMFDAGRVDAFPAEGTLVYWELGAAESCGDCVELAMHSPYTPDELPTTPGAGATRCLSNCACSLRIRYTPPTHVDLDVKRVDPATAKAMGLAALAVAMAALSKGKSSAPATQRDMDYDGEESVEALDWNKLDEMMSSLAKLKMLESEEPSRHRLHEELHENERFAEASRGLPAWLDPFSREVYAWHMIGVHVLEHVGRGQC